MNIERDPAYMIKRGQTSLAITHKFLSYPESKIKVNLYEVHRNLPQMFPLMFTKETVDIPIKLTAIEAIGGLQITRMQLQFHDDGFVELAPKLYMVVLEDKMSFDVYNFTIEYSSKTCCSTAELLPNLMLISSILPVQSFLQ